MRSRNSFGSALCLFGALALAGQAQAQFIFNQNFNGGDGAFSIATVGAGAAWTYGANSGVGGTGDGAWTIDGHNAVSFKTLTSPTIVVPTAGPVGLLFDHRFAIEASSNPAVTFDGAQVLLSVNGGNFNLVSPGSFTANGYNRTVSGSFSSPILGQPAFGGISSGYDTPAYITSAADLGNFSGGDTLQLQFFYATDSSFAAGTPSWVIDNIQLTAVPEPSTWALAGLALPAAWLARRRARRQA